MKNLFLGSKEKEHLLMTLGTHLIRSMKEEEEWKKLTADNGIEGDEWKQCEYQVPRRLHLSTWRWTGCEGVNWKWSLIYEYKANGNIKGTNKDKIWSLEHFINFFKYNQSPSFWVVLDVDSSLPCSVEPRDECFVASGNLWEVSQVVDTVVKARNEFLS